MEEEGGEDEDSPPPSGEGGSPKPPLPHPAPRNLLYWPKDRALIRRLDLICRAVLTAGEGPPLPPLHEDFGGVPGGFPEPAPPPPPPPPQAPPPFPSPRGRHQDKEFTVQIKDEEGLKLTFQKHRLGPNGAARGPPPQKKNSKKLVELELRCLEGLRDPGGDPENVMVAPPPPRGDAPEFADPRLLPFVEQRREKWHRKKFLPSPPSGLDLSKMVALMGGGASGGGGVASPSLAPPPRFRPEAEEEAEAGSGCCPLLADPMLPPTSDSD